MTYENIIFLQDSNADEAMTILDEQGEEALFQHLLQWDYGDSPTETRPDQPWGNSDTVKNYPDGYIMSYNTRHGYCGLIRIDETMRSTHELSPDELRETYYWQLQEIDEDVLDDEITCPADIPADVIHDHYEGINFVLEDFSCNTK